MGFFKKKYQKNVTRDNEFLKNYAIKTNGLLIFAENNTAVTAELNNLKADFQYSVATSDKNAKDLEEKIASDFDQLASALEQPQWEEAQILLMIKSIRRSIVNITSMR